MAFALTFLLPYPLTLSSLTDIAASIYYCIYCLLSNTNHQNTVNSKRVIKNSNSGEVEYKQTQTRM